MKALHHHFIYNNCTTIQAFKRAAHRNSYGKPFSRFKYSRAFSLIEILVVMVIIVLLLGISIPAIKGMTGSNSIAASGNMIAAFLDLARQDAISKNKVIEVRFYDCVSDGRLKNFCAFQLFEIDPSGAATPQCKVQILPSTVIIARDKSLSTLLDSSRTKIWTEVDPMVKIPNIGTSYDCRAIRFRPNGSTNLSADQKWHLTVIDGKDNFTSTKYPKNFSCVWVEPVMGSVQVLRP